MFEPYLLRHRIRVSMGGSDNVVVLSGIGSRTVRLQDAKDLVTCSEQKLACAISPKRLAESPKHTGDDADLGNALGVTEDDTDLRRSGTLLSQLADLVNDLVGVGLEPRGRSARVGDGGGADALSLAVKTAHLVCRFWCLAIIDVGGCCSVSEGKGSGKKFVVKVNVPWVAALGRLVGGRWWAENFRLIRATGSEEREARSGPSF
jgi:hypothetical protein